MVLETLSALLHFQEADLVEEIESALLEQSSGSLCGDDFFGLELDERRCEKLA